MLQRSSACTRWKLLADPVCLAAIVWSLSFVVIGARVLIKPKSQSVYPIFALAGQNWLAGIDLYELHDIRLDYYRYSPLVAAAFAPLSMLPERLGTILWRLINVAVFAWGLGWWFRAVLAQGVTRRPWSIAHGGILFLLVFPLAIGNVNNGQSNAFVVGLILMTLAAVAERRWNLASACIGIACLFKVYPIAVGLLLAAVYPRRFAGRMTLALAAGLALPFLLQSPGYVAEQYANWLTHMQSDDRQTWPTRTTYRDLRLLLRVWLVPLSAVAFQIIQFTVAAVLAGTCLFKSRVRSPEAERETMLVLCALACCWMTVFGPATESCTYIFLAPALGSLLLQAWHEGGALWERLMLLGSYALLLLAQIVNWFPFGTSVQSYGLQPFAGLVFFAYALIRAGRKQLREDTIVRRSAARAA